MKFKKTESLRIFILLLHKCWLVRKRHWITSVIVEIIVPIILIFCAWMASRCYAVAPYLFDVENETHYKSQSSEQLISQMSDEPMEITYAPSNPFTDKLMMKVAECLKSKANISGFYTETEVVANALNESYFSSIMAVIFDESTDESTTHLRYKLRAIQMKLTNLYNSLLQDDMSSYYTGGFVQIQICLDQSYVRIKSNNTAVDIPRVFIQRIPHPPHPKPRVYVRQYYIILLEGAFTILLYVETSKVAQEKFVGISALMSINGIPNTLNLLSWMISGLLLLSTLFIASVLLLTTLLDNCSLPFLNYGNSLVLFSVFILHLGHSMTFGIHLSAHFSKSFHLIYALIINAMLILLRLFILEHVYHYLIPYVGMIFPIILLDQVLEEIDTYEAIGIGIQWSNLFTNAIPDTKIGGTVGMIMILSVIGTFFHFLLVIYVYAINPGKYGIGRHPLFFLMRKSKKKDDNISNLIVNDENNKYFEPISAGTSTPGIQIRNLKKAYNISMFNKEKVHALRGVSIDFYKGQITSILGHNGAGKSTLMSILTGAASPTDGLILIDSKNLKDNASEILKDVGFYAQEDMYFPSLTVTEQLEFFAMVKKEDKPRSVIQSNVVALIQKLKLFNVRDSLPNKLSEEQKRKLCLGMAFVGDPNILILDEPTSRLDYENKRIIWDILLEMRGQKTILISTHDMEEADVLGDRIAIMYEGRIKSYGTSLYLKKLIAGQNNIEVTLSIERWSDQDKIRTMLHREASIIEKQDKKIVVSVPISPMLPEVLKSLEKQKKELGMSDYNLAHVGLEQVFLKVTEDSDSLSKPHEGISRGKVKLKGIALYIQSIRALFAKNFNYALKNLKTILIQVLTVFIALLGIYIFFAMMSHLYEMVPQTRSIQLDTYDNPYTIYTSSDENIGNQYKSISKSFGATSVEISDTNLDNALLQRAKKDLLHYNNYLVAAAEFNKTANGSLTANAFYSETITLSLPISLNLLSNVIVRDLLGHDYSISTSGQLLSHVFLFRNMKNWLANLGYITAVTLAIPIYLGIAMFAVHPSRESARGLKHLQKMTGVSGFTYWGTMFLSDLANYSLLVVLLIIGLVCVDYSLGLQLYGITEIMILTLLFMLLAINILPLIYSVSFLKARTSFVIKLFTFIPIGIVIVDCIVLVWKYDHRANEELYIITRVIYNLLPYVSFLHAQMQFHETGILNGICRRLSDDFYKSQCIHTDGLCCEENCHDRKCQIILPYFLDTDVDSLRVSVTYLCAKPILYFGILAVLEGQLIQKIMRLCTKQRVKKPSLDEQLQFEKSIIFQKIQALKGNRNIERRIEDNSTKEFFLAYELRKHYRKVRAVEDVSIMINGCNCFGLFGVNGAGKSTTFRMITGEEMPDHGMMCVGDKDFKNDRRNFLSQIGYCPQYDATLKCLNSYDHLRLFARLRGIPEDQVEDEVQSWINRLNLSACASQPSGTLSSGNNQRLNIAMSLVGKPNLVLLDEPTTRVDPGARRSFWKTVKSCQTAGQTFLLASHNMEECEALCERTAILLDGKLICIGTPEELKQRFGAGYDVQIRLNSAKAKSQLDRIKKDMRLLLYCVLTNENPGCLMYHVIGVGTTWRKIYDVMNKIKSKYDCVDDFLVVVRLST